MSSTEPTKARILFTLKLDNGAGFAVRMDEGSQVYTTKTTVFAARPEVGKSYEALLVPNSHPTALTPWFAVYVDPKSAEATTHRRHAEQVLAEGGVWTGEEMARAAGGNAPLWDAIFDGVYRAGGCSKFVRFDAPGAKPARAWYTSEPDSADVDVWEDAE